MTGMSLLQFGTLFEAFDPILHFVLLGGMILILLEVAVLLGDLLGTTEGRSHER